MSGHLKFPPSESDKQTCLRSVKDHTYFDTQNADNVKDQTG
jgi:hypothetical protein